MATVQENLQTSRENFAQQLADLSDPDKRRPNYTIAGRSVQWQAYMDWLKNAIRELDSVIAEESGDAGDLTLTALD